MLEKKFDTGAVVDQEKVDFGENEYVGDIQPRISDAALRVFTRSLESLLDGNPKTVPQDLSKASYFGKRTPEDGRIDFSKTAREVFNLIRGVSKPFPGAFTEIDGQKTVIWRAKIGEPANGIPAGTVASRNPLKIACADNFIEAEETEFAKS